MIRRSGYPVPEDEGMNYAWEYYVNQIHEVDDFIGRSDRYAERAG